MYRPSAFGHDKLWEPNIWNDLRQLYLDERGRSLDPSIYVGGIIDEAPGGSNIYESFIVQLDGLVTDKTIKHWKPLPYDWRLDYGDVFAAGTNIDGLRIEKMVDEVLALASSSPSGKATIIAHSLGGLVAKALIERLEDLDKAHLVDKLILVAVPQSGTPQAVAGLLHGDHSFGFPGNILITHELFRGLGEHAQSAFNLLPTPAYFARVAEPVAKFSASSTLPEIAKWRAMYGDSLDTPAELRDFLAGGDGRSKPVESDTDTPNVLSPNFLDKSATNASTQDAWLPLSTLKVTQIVGWGIETLKGVEYTERSATNCPTGLTGKCPHQVLDRRPQMITDGDKTVVSYSADKLGGESYYVDLQTFNLPRLNINRDHSDILEVPSVLALIHDMVKEVPIGDLDFIYTTKPVDENPSKRLAIHSPASIDIYDSEGRHTGLIPNPDPNSDLQLVEEQIPNSRYYHFGEGKYVSLPSEGTYRVVIKGTGEGTFTLELENGIAGNYSGRPIFSDIPVSPSTVATLNLDDNVLQLSLDQDGDGTFELVLDEGENVPGPEPGEPEEEVEEEEPVAEPAPVPAPTNTQQLVPSSPGGNGPIVGTFSVGGGKVLGAFTGPSVNIVQGDKAEVIRAKIIDLLKQVIVLLQEEVERLRLLNIKGN